MNELIIKKCIACPVAHKFLSEYYKFYRFDKERSTHKSKNKKELDNNIKSSVDKLAKILQIKSNYKLFVEISKDEMNINLSQKENTERNLKYNTKVACVKNLNLIISSLRVLFYDNKNPIKALSLFKKDDIILLEFIEEFLTKNNFEIDDKLTDDEKNWTKKYLITLGINNNDEILDIESEKAKKTYQKFAHILNVYCEKAIEKVSYSYCNYIYKNSVALNNVDIKQLGDCGRLYFSSVVNSLPKYGTNGIKRIIDNSTSTKRYIICKYLEKAKKYPKHIIDSLMKKQRITDTDIAILLFNNADKKADIESWHKTEHKDRELPKQAKLHIKELAKIFLVSEDVLSCGTGKIYGNWKIALDESRNKQFQDELLTADDIKELEKIEIPQHRRPSLKVKEQIYNRIRTFINLNENDFNKMISENPDFFSEEDFCLFTYEKDGKEYYDYDLMYENLLHPEDFDTLLSVLEELQAQENN